MKGKVINKTLRAAASTMLLAACLTVANSAQAQYAAPLQAPNAVMQPTAPYASVTNSPIPAPGSGSNIPASTVGDTGNSPAVPSPGADSTTGNIFGYGSSHDPGIIYLFHQQTGPNGENRGLKMAMTINPGTLSSTELGSIEGIVGTSLQSGGASNNVTVSDDQLAQISAIMAPYPSTTSNNGLKAITGDNPATGYPKTTAAYNWTPVLPTVKTFSRYLVILGVVAATIWMSMAAYGMILGMPYAGSRVLGTAMGLMMLLSAFTIWKIVQMNTFNGNTHAPAVINTRPFDNEVQPSATPGLPGVPGTQQYPTNGSGLPVQPLVGK